MFIIIIINFFRIRYFFEIIFITPATALEPYSVLWLPFRISMRSILSRESRRMSNVPPTPVGSLSGTPSSNIKVYALVAPSMYNDLYVPWLLVAPLIIIPVCSLSNWERSFPLLFSICSFVIMLTTFPVPLSFCGNLLAVITTSSIVFDAVSSCASKWLPINTAATTKIFFFILKNFLWLLPENWNEETLFY